MSSHVQSRTTKRFAPILAATTAAIGLLALAGCGSSSTTTSNTSSTPAATTTSPTSTPATTAATTPASTGAAASSALSLEANPEGQLKYNTTALTAKAGKVSIDFTNSSPLGHNMTIESSAGKVVGATPTFQGGSKTLALDLKAGTYKFFCSVPGHRMAGMEGTLTVK
ncbi:MAG TPA: plastocyanin/azurin family copper-binding protein [Solirubrobacteraceae bacterium]|nr:plastocyanin/azurin family copper-binding protein [Solirubrobacteraceae bacterium]